MKYKTAIFDLDGTLLNTLEDLTSAVNAALTNNQMRVRTMEEVRTFVGNGILKLMERAVPSGKENPAFEKALRDFKTYYEIHCNDVTAPYPGILDTLKKLKEKGIKMAIVSNKADFAVKELNSLYFEEIMDVSYGENEAQGIRKKPAPDMVLQALEDLSCKKDQAVYIGDSDVDLDTAEAVGIPCIGVSWGFRGRTFLEEKGVTVIIDRPEQLEDFF